MINFIKHYCWFLITSCNFLNKNIFEVIAASGLKKSYKFAEDMCKWDKMTIEQRENWYLNADRTIEF